MKCNADISIRIEYLTANAGECERRIMAGRLTTMLTSQALISITVCHHVPDPNNGEWVDGRHRL